MLIAERFWAKVDKTGECWEWTGGLRGRDGYGGIWWEGRHLATHRLSYILHHPLSIDLCEHREICVCHRCDNPLCVNPAHLFLGSRADNNNDKKKKGRAKGARGILHHDATLTETQVREIRERCVNGGITQRQLALEYSITPQNICCIIHHKYWKHI